MFLLILASGLGYQAQCKQRVRDRRGTSHSTPWYEVGGGEGGGGGGGWIWFLLKYWDWLWMSSQVIRSTNGIYLHLEFFLEGWYLIPFISSSKTNVFLEEPFLLMSNFIIFDPRCIAFQQSWTERYVKMWSNKQQTLPRGSCKWTWLL